jgi:hypothetical protein
MSQSSGSLTGYETWRVYNIEVPFTLDPGKDHIGMHSSLTSSILKSINPRKLSPPPGVPQLYEASVLKKAFDGRRKRFGQPHWVYTVNITLPSAVVKKFGLKEIPGRFEKEHKHRITPSLTLNSTITTRGFLPRLMLPRVVIVGAGPAGLFAAITLVKAGLKPIIIERGYPVEVRGRDIGALFNRRLLNQESNLCYGEGGAGTWSDGKLTTRIGKNSEEVQCVLETLVSLGAPPRILIDSKPHLGTDRLVRILKALRGWLMEQGVEFRFGSKVEDLGVSNTHKEVNGVVLTTGSSMFNSLLIRSPDSSFSLWF